MQPLPPFPPITPELLAALEAHFPHRCPDPKTPDREIWLYAGKRSVVDYLREVATRQAENLEP
jgi:hypothetical protein